MEESSEDVRDCKMVRGGPHDSLLFSQKEKKKKKKEEAGGSGA